MDVYEHASIVTKFLKLERDEVGETIDLNAVNPFVKRALTGTWGENGNVPASCR